MAAPDSGAGSGTVADPPASNLTGTVLDPVDPGDWVHQQDMTWEDYNIIPGAPAGWADGSISGKEQEFKAAVVLLDFTDQPMLITQEPGSHPFGSPTEGFDPVAEEDAAEWYEDYLNTPNEYNQGHTITEYWMENSNGRISVDVDAFGTYHLPGKQHEYGLGGHAPVTGPNSVCPAGDDCTKDLRDDGFEAWYADQGKDIYKEYDILFWVTAGHDESGAWQEFGNMKFADREDIPANLGPPGAEDGPVYNDAGNEIANWAPTRYVEWTSWRAAATHWPNASGRGKIPNSTQSEASGQATFQHEMSHLLGIGDNYNNPFGNPPIRSYSGHWDMLSRGTFNGPGGTHNRWQVPNAGGSAMGSHFSLRNKMKLDLVGDGQVVQLDAEQLDEQGVATTTVSARSVNWDDRLAGLNVRLTGGDQSSCAAEGHVGELAYLCDGGNYNNYTIEVVDQMGADSFTPSSGVHLAKTKNQDRAPFIWTIDANPDDIGWVDFVRPDGTPVMISAGDPRQLNDAMFRAGTRSGADFEYIDEANGLHFYILERERDAQDVLTYDVAVRSLDGAGGFERGVSADSKATKLKSADAGKSLTLTMPLTNTGEAGANVFDSDVYRISAEVSGNGWELTKPHEVVAAAAGETVQVPVHLTHAGGGPATVTLTAVSESDPSASVTVKVDAYQLLKDQAVEVLDGYVEDGTIRNGLAQQLQAHLDNAVRAIERGDVDKAERFVDRYERGVHLVRDGEARLKLLAFVQLLHQD